MVPTTHGWRPARNMDHKKNPKSITRLYNANAILRVGTNRDLGLEIQRIGSSHGDACNSAA